MKSPGSSSAILWQGREKWKKLTVGKTLETPKMLNGIKCWRLSDWTLLSVASDPCLERGRINTVVMIQFIYERDNMGILCKEKPEERFSIFGFCSRNMSLFESKIGALTMFCQLICFSIISID